MSKWYETNEAADELGLRPRQLRKLRTKMFKAGKHYRLKNPQATRPEYLWNVESIDATLTSSMRASMRSTGRSDTG